MRDVTSGGDSEHFSGASSGILDSTPQASGHILRFNHFSYLKTNHKETIIVRPLLTLNKRNSFFIISVLVIVKGSGSGGYLSQQTL